MKRIAAFGPAIILAGLFIYFLGIALQLHREAAAARATVSPPAILPSLALALTPSPAPSEFPPEDFDFVKRDREWDWCKAHHGIPAMTFTHEHSNVLCLRSEAVIPFPAEGVK